MEARAAEAGKLRGGKLKPELKKQEDVKLDSGNYM
jgi:hypothetical protein